MPTFDLKHAALLIAYAVLTAVINLVFSKRSQIDEWCEANPKLAFLAKFCRGFGVDPWTILQSAVLLFTSKLPDYQKQSLAELKKPKTPSYPMGMMLALCLAFAMTGCGLLAAVSPYLAEAGVLIADATNAVNAAESILPSLHLPAADQAKAEAALAKCRGGIAAAAEADNGAKDLTKEQLDASLASFRAAWGDVQQTFAAKKAGMGASPEDGSAPLALPVPLATRRVYQ